MIYSNETSFVNDRERIRRIYVHHIYNPHFEVFQRSSKPAASIFSRISVLLPTQEAGESGYL